MNRFDGMMHVFLSESEITNHALVEIDGVRNMYLRRTQRNSSKGERHDAAKDARPHNLISVSSA